LKIKDIPETTTNKTIAIKRMYSKADCARLKIKTSFQKKKQFTLSWLISTERFLYIFPIYFFEK
jgi:hypothetical protein